MVEELTKTCKARSHNLDSIRPLKKEEKISEILTKTTKLCAWCAETPISGGNQKYCSDICRKSVMAWGYPQKEEALAFLLHRQGYKCNLCPYDYKPLVATVVNSHRSQYSSTEFNFETDLLSWSDAKRLKNLCPKGRNIDIDHIVAIYNGGTSLGIDNHQAICKTCHIEKTKKDLSGPRKKKSS